MFETNPLDETCNKRIRLSAEPLLVTYDANTLQKVANMFEAKETSQLVHLSQAARKKIENLKKTSALGLEYAIQNQEVMDVDILVKGSYIALPYGGSTQSGGSKILCNMGNFSIKSLGSRKLQDLPKVSQMVRIGSTGEEIMKEMLSRSYDRYSVGLENVQLLSVFEGEDWTKLLKQEKQDFFILKPMSK